VDEAETRETLDDWTEDLAGDDAGIPTERHLSSVEATVLVGA